MRKISLKKRIKARKVSLLVWRYILDHPGCTKNKAYEALKIDYSFLGCALCELFLEGKDGVYTCGSCPFVDAGIECYENSPYSIWRKYYKSDWKKAKKAVKKIIMVLEKWEPK